MNISLLDLTAQYRTLRPEILAAVTEVLDSQVCIGGPKVAELEQKIAALSGCGYGVGVSSGTDALLCSIMALGIGPGDEVITTPFTFFASAGSIARTGARPVFVDIDPATFNLDPELLERAITPRCKAIMPVHLFGQMCMMDPIVEIAQRHGLHVIEDAAQSISASYRGRRAGSIGTMGCFSFYPSKNLGAAGDGGMIVTNDEALQHKLRLFRNHGAQTKYSHQYVGGNFRLDPIQAAVLLVKLPHLEQWCEARRRHAAHYTQRFAGTPVASPVIHPDCTTVYNQYVVRVARRDALMEHLKANGVGTEVYYPKPMHLQECWKDLGYTPGSLPQAEAASAEVLALPVYPELDNAAIDHVADLIIAFASRCA